MNHAEIDSLVRAAPDGWVAVAPSHMPPPEHVVVGWHGELESPVVIFYDITHDDDEGPRWSACADGGNFPLNVITHWRYCTRPGEADPNKPILIIDAPYCTLHIREEGFVDHVDMRIAALSDMLRLMAADDPENFMTSLCMRLAGDLRSPWSDLPRALTITKQLGEILLQEQTTSTADLLWLCQQFTDELRLIFSTIIDNTAKGARA